MEQKQINEGNKLIAEWLGYVAEQEIKSTKLAFEKVDIDTDFCIDIHLQELYDECINAIIKSDFFELPND